MSEPIHDADALARYRQAEAQTVETDIEKCLEPGEGVRECTVPVKPGYGQWAYKAGCEDEYIDRMRSRYDGEY